MTSCTASSQLMEESGDNGTVLIKAGTMSSMYVVSHCSWGSTSFLASKKFQISPCICAAGSKLGGAPNVTHRLLLPSLQASLALLNEPCRKTKPAHGRTEHRLECCYVTNSETNSGRDTVDACGCLTAHIKFETQDVSRYSICSA